MGVCELWNRYRAARRIGSSPQLTGAFRRIILAAKDVTTATSDTELPGVMRAGPLIVIGRSMVWVPETAPTTRDLLVRQRQVARHDPLVALRLIYQMFSNLLSWIVLRTRSDTAKDIEILVLRHQLAVLQRRTPRPRMSWTDRALIAALTRLLPVRRRLGLLITPATVLGWHRRLVARPLDHPTDPTRSIRHQRQPPATPHARPGRSPTTTPPANDERHEHRPTARPARWAAP
jgi:hypothetical protein